MSSTLPKSAKVVPFDSPCEEEGVVADVKLLAPPALPMVQTGIAWKRVTKTVNSRFNNEPVKLVDSCSGAVLGGEITALMGLSGKYFRFFFGVTSHAKTSIYVKGCGKTTLLRVLSGRDNVACTGEIFFGGNQVSLDKAQVWTQETRRKIGYVAQDDTFFESLTVREHLTFTTLLRGNSHDKLSAVDQVIEDLNMKRCEHNPIKVLSGGERKRCSIATELLSDPFVLVLDEATSGLDSAVSSALIGNLRKLANGERAISDNSNRGLTSSKKEVYAPSQPSVKLAIIMSIHQPSTGLFYLFDNVIFMVEGKSVYYGPTTRCMSYLARVGYQLPKSINEEGVEEALAYNPADYMMELLFSIIVQEEVPVSTLPNPTTTKRKKKGKNAATDDIRVKKSAKELWAFVRRKFFRERNTNFMQTLKAVAFKRSRFSPEFVGWWPRYILMSVYDDSLALADADRFAESFLADGIDTEGSASKHNIGNNYRRFVHEVWILLNRSLKCSSRSSSVSTFTILEVVCIGLLAGLTWFQTELLESKISKFSGFLFFLCAYWFFAGLYTGLLDFLPERMVVKKDHAAGAYSLLSYYLARTFGGIPARIFLPAVFAMVACLLGMHPSVYLESGDGGGAGSFIAVILLLMLTALTGEALGVLLGIASNNLDQSVTIANVTGLSMTIFGGFYIKDLPIFMKWLKYLSVLKYCFDALCQAQFPSDAVIECEGGWYIAACYNNNELTGAEVRRWLNVETLSLGGNVGAMIAIYVGLKIAGYLALVYNAKYSS